MCPHWLQGDSMAILVWEEFCSGLASLPCSFLILRCTGGKLHVQVQEQTAAGVLIVTHPKALEGQRGESEVSGAISECLLCC